MANNKKENPVAVYAVVSQIGFLVLTPLLVFVIGGTALSGYMGWPDWVDVIFVVLGILTMLCSCFVYLKKLIKMFDKNEGSGTTEVSHDRRDHDYYDDSIKKKRL